MRKLKDFLKMEKARRTAARAEYLLIKLGDVEGKVTGNAPLQAQMQPDSLEGDNFLTLYVHALQMGGLRQGRSKKKY